MDENKTPDSSEENYNGNKSSGDLTPIIFATLFLVAIICEFYFIINDSFDSVMLVGTGIIAVVLAFLTFQSFSARAARIRKEQMSQYEAMLKTQKALYLATKKSTAAAEVAAQNNIEAIKFLAEKINKNEQLVADLMNGMNTEKKDDLEGLVDELAKSNARLAQQVQTAITVDQLVKSNADLVKNVQGMLGNKRQQEEAESLDYLVNRNREMAQSTGFVNQAPKMPQFVEPTPQYTQPEVSYQEPLNETPSYEESFVEEKIPLNEEPFKEEVIEDAVSLDEAVAKEPVEEVVEETVAEESEEEIAEEAVAEEPEEEIAEEAVAEEPEEEIVEDSVEEVPEETVAEEEINGETIDDVFADVMAEEPQTSDTEIESALDDAFDKMLGTQSDIPVMEEFVDNLDEELVAPVEDVAETIVEEAVEEEIQEVPVEETVEAPAEETVEESVTTEETPVVDLFDTSKDDPNATLSPEEIAALFAKL